PTRSVTATNTMTPMVVTFGELLLRLSPPGFERFFQSPAFSAVFGGGEANVAASLAQFGLHSRFVTALPAHAIGDAALRSLGAAAAATALAIAEAKRAGARVSIDLNYRSKLWTEAKAQATMRPFVHEVDAVIANEEDLQAVLGIPVEGADVRTGSLNVSGYQA